MKNAFSDNSVIDIEVKITDNYWKCKDMLLNKSWVKERIIQKLETLELENT